MATPDNHASIVVIGAGAAGLMAALSAARAGGDVLLVERTKDGGRKILISGGGRCNILPSVLQPERYVTDSSPNTLKKLLRAWPLAEQRRFFEAELGMPLELEEETGKLFPSSHRARDVRDTLVRRVHEAGAQVWFSATVTDVRPESGQWIVELDGAPPVLAERVVIATGGLSVPKTGSDGTGLRIAEALGHVVHPTYPALTPLTADPHPQAALAGVSGPVSVSAPNSRPPFRTTGGFLITHDGWSGPTVLDASHLAIRGRADGARQELLVSWTVHDAATWDDWLRGSSGTVRNTVAGEVPRRLADALLAEAGVDPATRLAQLRREDRRTLVEALTAWPMPWTGSAGYKKAEVTGGGVALDQVNPRTMESRVRPGLHLCGEVLDSFGPIGGHNFAWAWATGRAAGEGAHAGVASGEEESDRDTT
ncbi:MAG: aminoacetone oxidase family FAD-binding enzyme [Gemmatimonadota bacterium]